MSSPVISPDAAWQREKTSIIQAITKATATTQLLDVVCVPLELVGGAVSRTVVVCTGARLDNAARAAIRTGVVPLVPREGRFDVVFKTGALTRDFAEAIGASNEWMAGSLPPRRRPAGPVTPPKRRPAGVSALPSRLPAPASASARPQKSSVRAQAQSRVPAPQVRSRLPARQDSVETKVPPPRPRVQARTLPRCSGGSTTASPAGAMTRTGTLPRRTVRLVKK